MTERPAQAQGTKRWGLRTLAFLVLAAASLVVRYFMYSSGNTDFVLLTFIALVIGLVGAFVCSVRGLREWNGFTPS